MPGFYTDDFTEQDFKAPEEIRKANLRGADLRGANIEGVDFYLVDLRNARYDASQVDQLRASGAIRIAGEVDKIISANCRLPENAGPSIA